MQRKGKEKKKKMEQPPKPGDVSPRLTHPTHSTPTEFRL